MAAIIHFSANALQFLLPVIFFAVSSATAGIGGIFSFSNLFSGLLNASINATHGAWYLFTFILGVLVWFLDVVDLWNGALNGWGLWISILIAITNISLYVMVLALASALADTRFYIDFAIYTVGQIGYIITMMFLGADAKGWFMDNLGLIPTECAEEAQECIEAEECEDPEAEDCTYEADLALYEACTAFNEARDECLAAKAAELEEACASCEGDDCPEDCPEGDAEDVEEEEEEAFFF